MWKALLVIFFFLIAKSFQFLNGFALVQLLSNRHGLTILLVSLFFVLIMLASSGFKPQASTPPAFSWRAPWVYAVLAIAVCFSINPAWGMMLMGSLFFFALISMEARVLRSLHNSSHIPRWIPALLSFLPLVIAYQFPQTHDTTIQVFYVVSSLFAFIASYLDKQSPPQRQHIPLWVAVQGLAFIAVSGLLYKEALVIQTTSAHLPIIAFAFFFYVGGATALYLTLDGWIGRHAV